MKSAVGIIARNARLPPLSAQTNATKISRSFRRRDNIVVISLLAASGNPVFSNNIIAPIVLIIIIGYLSINYGQTDDTFFYKRFFGLASGFCVIMLAHILQFKLIAPLPSLFFLFKLFAGGLALHKIGPRLPERLFSVVFWLSVSSLALQAILLAVGPEAMPGIESADLFGSNIKSLVIFTVLKSDEWRRNSSMMWEPGAFQAIINFSLALLPVSSWMERRRRWRMFCVFVALLSTFSTTGYLLLFVIVVMKISQLRQFWLFRLVFIFVIGLAAYFAISQLDFLGEKIGGQLENSYISEGFTPDRFGSLLFDLHYIEKNPVFGNGLTEATRFADNPELQGIDLGHSNGLSNFVATFGFFGLTLYFGALIWGQTGVTRADRIILAIVVAIIAFGEQFLGYALFLGLPFLRLAAARSSVTIRRPLAME